MESTDYFLDWDRKPVYDYVFLENMFRQNKRTSRRKGVKNKLRRKNE